MQKAYEYNPESVETKQKSLRRKVLRPLGRAGASLVGGALLAAPVAATESLSTAEISDSLGPIPATVSYEPGYSSADLGIFGSVYDKSLTESGVGLGIKVDGPPEIGSNADIEDTIKSSSSLVQDPESAIDGYKSALFTETKHNFLKRELEYGAVLSVLGFLMVSAKNLSPRDKKRIYGSAAVLSLMAGAHTLNSWENKNPYPEQNYSISASLFENDSSAVADNPLLAHIVDDTIPTIKKQRNRNTEAVNAFESKARASIDEELDKDKFVPPSDNETLVLALSDIHSNEAMINTYQYFVDSVNKKYGDDTLKLTLLVGDQTYGSATEKQAVKDISEISSSVYGILGNHDSKFIGEQSEDDGIVLLNGKTKETPSGLDVLGAPDPSLTKPLAMMGLDKETSVPRTGNTANQEKLGEQLDSEAQKTDPAFVLTHEGYSIGPLINEDNVSQDSMKKWLDKKSKKNQKPTDVPAGAVLYGHWHRDFDYRVVPNSDGYNSVVAEMGTAGGASSAISLSNLSFPFTTPANESSAVLFRVDNDEQVVTGLQEINTSTGGNVTFQPAKTILQPLENSNSSNLIAEKP